ncbi:MAG: phosphoribosyltransferase [Deltaproteobacteria bacterium]|nr:phosphoribosyltransferase [Deltaproteobacteria bacterium]
MTADIMQILTDVGAILTDGHFVYTSGLHGSAYVNKDALYPHTRAVQTICAQMAAPFADQRIETVAGPTIGGVILAQWIAHALCQASDHDVAACYAEERVIIAGSKERCFGRGYDKFISDRRVLIAEDILTTGGSVNQVVTAVRACGGNPVAVTALCNRGGVRAGDIGGVPITALLTLPLEAWNAADCPLCKKGIPINTTIGKGKAVALARG